MKHGFIQKALFWCTMLFCNAMVVAQDAAPKARGGGMSFLGMIFLFVVLVVVFLVVATTWGGGSHHHHHDTHSHDHGHGHHHD